MTAPTNPASELRKSRVTQTAPPTAPDLPPATAPPFGKPEAVAPAAEGQNPPINGDDPKTSWLENPEIKLSLDELWSAIVLDEKNEQALKNFSWSSGTDPLKALTDYETLTRNRTRFRREQMQLREKIPNASPALPPWLTTETRTLLGQIAPVRIVWPKPAAPIPPRTGLLLTGQVERRKGGRPRNDVAAAMAERLHSEGKPWKEVTEIVNQELKQNNTPGSLQALVRSRRRNRIKPAQHPGTKPGQNPR